MGLIDNINKFRKPSVLVIGDFILDSYVRGKVSRISPEAPIQILNLKKPKEYKLGGAANVAHNLITLGANVSCVGVTGNDEGGRELKKLLKKIKVNTSGIIKDPSWTTPIKTRLIDSDHNQQVLRIDEEIISPVKKQTERKLISQIKKAIRKNDIVLISDYLKGTLTESLLKSICRLGRIYNKKVIVGPKGRNYEKYRNATAIIPNRSEAEFATGIEVKTAEGKKKAAKHLIQKLNLKFVIITLGSDGIYLMNRKGKSIEDSAKKISVYDVTGAGDTVLATIGLTLASGLDYKDTIHMANLAAGVVIGKVGTATVSREEIIEHYYELTQLISSERKIKSLPISKKILAKLKDKTIVFTNGCFDILHPGHIKSLNFAKSQGDILIVGLNSDKSVRSIKGKTRPIFTQSLRARSLASLECVDYIIMFNESTPLNLIQKIKPDILIKGSDWKGKKIIGRNLVKKVILAPMEKGISTSKIINKLS